VDGREESLVRDLGELLAPDRVLAGSAVRRAYACDAYTVDRSPPVAVVQPLDTAEVQAVVRWCNATSTPFTPRGAGTGLSGGAMPAMGGVVISTKRMTAVLEVDPKNRSLRAQAGAVNVRLTAAGRPFGLHFAPDPSSQTVSTLGGNIAENSGGPHTLKYGVTVQHVLAVTLVDAAGDVHEIGSRVPGGPGYDLLSLVVGAEGTLGLVTEAWVRLTPDPECVQTVLASFPTVRTATEAVSAIIAGGTLPAALEMMDENVLVAVRAAFGLDAPDGTKALLLVECDGQTVQATADIETVEAVCRASGCLDVQRARDEADRLRLWTARKKGIGAMGRLAPTIVTHDGVIPRSRLPEMLEFVYATAAEAGVPVANIFHAGDGNLHPCFYFDDRVPGAIERVVEAGERILRRCVELGGSVTGEHGVGVEKLGAMKLMFDESDMAWQRSVREAFGVTQLCNPCKVVPDQKGCVEHMRRWRGAAT
jgi:glycolate oxidase